ncbi:MAG: phosphate ABC transporter ATP-binding protein [Bacillota bacterium]
MLEVRNISKRYGQQLVLNRVNFTFKPGVIYGIIGPNGAGKSTFLRILTAFEKPDSGEVFFKDKRLNEPIDHISCMWQKPYLFNNSVYENIAYGLKVRGKSKEEIDHRVKKLLVQFRLEHLVEKHARFLSGGEGARVALARAIACESPFIILDEPAANLDPPNTRMIEELLSEVQQEKGLTVILVTHDMFQARRLAHFTLFMENGELQEANVTSHLFANPEKLSTQKFLRGLL